MDILSFALGMKLGKSQSGGGGTSGDERVKYVTFMYGDRELLKYPVISGDTCHDPVADEMIDTPTKEQTVSTVYTYSGWALTDGGAASSSALANVTEDRTVYVAFAESARMYTINFYDGETLLKSEQVAYGTKPSYVPTKDGYIFMGFEPALAEVTGDADYIASFEEAHTFADASWEYISRVSKAGSAATAFALGDTRTETLTWSDGTTETITLQIAAIYRHKTQDGVSVMTLVPTKLLSKRSKWASSVGSYYNSYSYNSGVNVLKPFLENTVIPAFSSSLQSVLQTANCLKQYVYWGAELYYPISPLTLYELGFTEAGVNASDASKALYGFSNTDASRVRTFPDGSKYYWWTADGHGSNKSGTASSYQGYKLTVADGGWTSVSPDTIEAGVMFKIFV